MKPSWKPDRTWIVKKSTRIHADLSAIRDSGSHYVIAPRIVMSLNHYKALLSKINKLTVRADEDTEQEQEVGAPLSTQSNHEDENVRSLTNALLAVYHDRLGPSDWDENDYACVASIAMALDSGETSLDEILCREGVEYSKSQYIVTEAIGVFVSADVKKRNRLSRNDAQDDEMAKRHALLISALGLDKSAHPLVAVLEVGDSLWWQLMR
jgi:hypothetical protein